MAGLSFKYLEKDHFLVSSGDGYESSIVKMNKPFLEELLKPYVETKGLLKKDLLDIFKNINHTLELEKATAQYEAQQELPMKKLEEARNYENQLTKQQMDYIKLEEATRNYENQLKQISHNGIKYGLDENTNKIYKDGEYVGDLIMYKGKKSIKFLKAYNNLYKTIEKHPKSMKKVHHHGIEYGLEKSTNKIYKDGKYVADLIMYKGKKSVKFLKQDKSN